MSNHWPRVPLGEVLNHRKEFITIDDVVIYKRARVQLHAQGIVLRDEVPGALIKTKKQQVSRAGEFLIAEIDAKVGGFGIVPDALDGAIVSSHYFLFVPNEEKIEKRFLHYLIQTPAFRNQVEAQGSTNYAAIRPADALDYEIPLPPIGEQRRIIARIEELAGDIHEARALRQQATDELDSLVTSLHASLAGQRLKMLGAIVKLDEEQEPVSFNGSYPQVGMKSFGGGLFPKGPVEGGATTYRAFNRLYEGALVLSQVKGWEGAVAVCPAELAGWFVSPEYRTFRCISTEVRPRYLAALVRTEWFWRKLSHATRGVGARRERTRPEQFLTLEIPMPDVKLQERAEVMFAEVSTLKCLQAETAAEFNRLLPAIIARAFEGRL